MRAENFMFQKPARIFPSRKKEGETKRIRFGGDKKWESFSQLIMRSGGTEIRTGKKYSNVESNVNYIYTYA